MMMVVMTMRDQDWMLVAHEFYAWWQCTNITSLVSSEWANAHKVEWRINVGGEGKKRKSATASQRKNCSAASVDDNFA